MILRQVDERWLKTIHMYMVSAGNCNFVAMYINKGNPCVVNVCYQNEVCCVEIFINEVEELIFSLICFTGHILENGLI